MKNLKELNDRRAAAIEAKKLLLKKFESAPKADDPEVIARRAEREAIVAAREARKAERDRMAKVEEERKLAEAQALAEAAAAEAEALAAEAKDRIARVVLDEAARKAERDRRYAARKAKQR